MKFIRTIFTNKGGVILEVKLLSRKYKLDEKELNRAIVKLNNKDVLLFTMSGKMGAGKDTVGDIISEGLTSKGYFIKSVSFGYLIRAEVDNVVREYNKSEDKESYAIKVNASKEDLDKLSTFLRDCTVYDRTDEARAALQYWGTEVRRSQNGNYWINRMSEFIVDSVNNGYSVSVTDARFPNETELVEDLLGKVIRLDVPEDVRVKRVEIRDNIKVNLESLVHISELALDDYEFDKVFDGERSPDSLAKDALNFIL